MVASQSLTTHELSTSRSSSSSSCSACFGSNTYIHGVVVMMPSSDSHPWLSFASMRSTDDDTTTFSVSLFSAARLRIVVELPSSPVAVRFSSRIVIFAGDDAITAGYLSFWHPMSAFPRCVSVRFVDLLCPPLTLSRHPLLLLRVDTLVDDDGSVTTESCSPRFFRL